MSLFLTERVALFGGNGQIGKHLARMFQDKKLTVLTRKDVDLANTDAIYSILNDIKPDIIVNAAAYTAVDKAEEEEELAFKINALAPEAMAKYVRDNAIGMVHFSTDYVYSGVGRKAWREVDQPAPLSAYGRTKLEGDKRIIEILKEKTKFYLILRTSWVYDDHGKNFVDTMLKLGAENEEIKVVNDQFGAPSYAPHLASAAEYATDFVRTRFNQSGIYNLCNAGVTTWYDFAVAIFDEARKYGIPLKVKRVIPISTNEFPRPAKRPLNSRLDSSKLKKIMKIELEDWQEGLRQYMEHRSGCNHHH